MKKYIISAFVAAGVMYTAATCVITENTEENKDPSVKPKVDSDPLVEPVQDASKAEPQFIEYTVKKGDTLSEISERFYNNWVVYPQVARASGIKNPHLIYPGDKIKLPKYIKTMKVTAQRV